MEIHLYFCRYKVQITVGDSTGSASFAMFETDVVRFIGKSAEEYLAEKVW